MSLAKLVSMVHVSALPQMAKDIPAAQHKAILANIKSAGWVGIQIDSGMLPGWAIEGDMVTFHGPPSKPARKQWPERLKTRRWKASDLHAYETARAGDVRVIGPHQVQILSAST